MQARHFFGCILHHFSSELQPRTIHCKHFSSLIFLKVQKESSTKDYPFKSSWNQNAQLRQTLNLTITSQSKTFSKFYSSHTFRSMPFTMKLQTPEFQSLFTPELKKLIEVFDRYNYELRIAGGPVRDLLMNIIPHDIDFATTATPDQMKEMFEKEGIRMINAKGESHGTITCRINDKENYEVTTLRIDVTTDGRHAEVEFTTDWQVDALRRDLTINSMFLGFDGTIYDYFTGCEDVENRRVRFVGDATSRIQEDYLRILRYFRFYGRIAKEPNAHEQDTLRSIKENMHGLQGISGERILMEMKKILTGNHAGSLLNTMVELGMSKFIGFPDRPNTAEFTKVWERCHDLKPLPFTLVPALMDDENQMYKLNERLKISRDEIRLGLFILQHREDDFGLDPFRHCQDMMCDTAGKDPKTKERICQLLKYLNLRDTLSTFQSWTPPKFPVNGHVLLQMGVPKGPTLAKTLNALRQIWKESSYTKGESELLEHVEELKKTIS